MSNWPYITLIQAMNFAVWTIVFFLVWIPEWIELLWILLVGVVAGTVYVNLFYEVIKRRDLNTNEEAISINLIMMGLLIGTLCAVGLQVSLWNIPNPQTQ